MLVRSFAVIVILSAVALLLVVLRQPPSASAAPRQPHVVFGQARTESGTILSSGLVIQARINNINYAQTINPTTGVGTQSTQTHAQNSSGLNYGTAASFQVCADDLGTSAVEGGQDGQQIFFYVNGIQAQALRSTDTTPVASIGFESGQATQRVDLIIPSLSASAAGAATASSAACTTQAAPTAPTPTPTVTPTPTPVPPFIPPFIPPFVPLSLLRKNLHRTCLRRRPPLCQRRSQIMYLRI